MKKRKYGISSKLAQAILPMTIIVMLTAGLFSQSWADVKTYVKVQNEAWVKGEKVYLKDVATVKGPAHLRERLEDIYLAYAPGPGRSKTLHGSWIASKVRSKRWLTDNTVLKIPEFVSVKRTCQVIQDESFFERYADYVAQQIQDPGVEFEIHRFKVIGNGPLPEGDVRIELTKQSNGKLMKHVSLNAIVEVDEAVERRVVLSGWVDRFEKVVCAVRPLRRHAILSKDDLCLRRKNISKLPGNVIQSLHSVVGKRLKHTIGANDALSARAVERVPLIKRGDRVVIIAESSNLLVSAVGIAQGKGFSGDQIRIRNCMGNKKIIARIVDSSTVKVDF